MFSSKFAFNDAQILAWYKFDGNLNNEEQNNFQIEKFGDFKYGTDRNNDTTHTLVFNGINNYLKINIGDIPKISISLWFKVYSSYAPPTLIDYGSKSIYTLVDAISGATPARYKLSHNTHTKENLLTNNSFLYNEWHHIYVDVGEQGVNSRVFIDGVLDQKSLKTANLHVDSDFLYVGLTSDPNEVVHFYLFGEIDDLAIFDGPLLENEIVSVYESGLSSIHSDNVDDQTIIFPNPTTGIINISSRIKYKNISVFNIHGDKVLEFEAEDTIDLKSMGKGIYYIQIRGQSNSYTKTVRIILI